MTVETVYMLLGSNLGRRRLNLLLAREKIRSIGGVEITAESSLYHSTAVDMGGKQPPFLNQVIRASCTVAPMQLLDAIEEVERDLGRVSKGMLLPRTIDIDILFYGRQVIDTARLVIPHKRVLEREFAVIPLLEIEPDFILPDKHERLDMYLQSMTQSNLKQYKEHGAPSN